jgi:hypothetical protein
MVYKIKQYTLDQARRLGLQVAPSKNPKHKIDVYDKFGNFLASVGAQNYMDFPSYLEKDGYEIAMKRRKLYKIRHERDRHILGSKGWLADNLLW